MTTRTEEECDRLATLREALRDLRNGAKLSPPVRCRVCNDVLTDENLASGGSGAICTECLHIQQAELHRRNDQYRKRDGKQKAERSRRDRANAREAYALLAELVDLSYNNPITVQQVGALAIRAVDLLTRVPASQWKEHPDA